MTDKTCFTCHETKPVSEFYANPQKADGLSTYCKVCFKARQATYYRDRHPVIPKTEGMKRCSTCKIEKTLAEFSRHKNTKDGLQYQCRPCQVACVTKSRRKDPTSHRRSSKAWRERNLVRHADNNAKRNYGIDHGTYDRMLADQNGACGICKTTEPGVRLGRFHIDHCHGSKKVRGLLCERCNRGIGHFDDSTEKLKAAIVYLETTAAV